MRLFEAILAANHRAIAGDDKAGLHRADFADALPVVALTCIDPRLNPLLPEVLGIDEMDFIWLRNAGNIIFDPMSTMMRTLALACAVKGGREIVILGHSDCHVRKTSMLDLTDRFKALGIDRARLPENLNEFFGLFASERQNVIRSAEVVRSSPLIGARIPVHGLLVDIVTGKLEWVVNGYESFASASSPAAVGTANVPVGAQISESAATSALAPLTAMKGFDLGEMKFPEMKIGELAGDVQRTASTAEKLITELKQRDLRPAWQSAKDLAAEVKETARDAREAAQHLRQTAREFKDMTPTERLALLSRGLDRAKRFRIIGSDQKQYGPISGAKLLEWLADDRITGDTPVQPEGGKSWQKLSQLAETVARTVPPPLDPR